MIPKISQLHAMLKFHCRMARAYAAEGLMQQYRRAEQMARKTEQLINARVSRGQS